MAADLYSPKEIQPTQKLPGIVLCNGTGGTKAKLLQRVAASFVNAGFIVLAFDYRGWGESDSKLITLEPQPRPNVEGNIQATTRALRWQMNYTDQTEDIRAALAFLAGEPQVDPNKIGLWGTSYGGGLVLWVAGNDPRVKFTIAQVPGMQVRSTAAESAALKLATKQARGETESVPFETGKLSGKLASYDMMRVNPARTLGFSPLEAAEKIRTPVLIIDAEKEELMDIRKNGARAAELIKGHGTPVDYHVISNITHYGVYKEKFREVMDLEVSWLKDLNLAKQVGSASEAHGRESMPITP